MKRYIIILCVIFALLLTGCGKKDSIGEYPVYMVGGSKVNIYYPMGDEMVCEEEQYQLKQPDSIVASVEELMSIIPTHLKGNLIYHTYMFDEKNNLTLDFVLEGEACEKEYELLTKASVAKTLFQLKDMGSIRINISSAEGTIISSDVYNSDSFYFYGYDLQLGLDTTRYKVYYPNEDGTMLRKKWVTRNARPYESPQVCIVEALKQLNLVPEGTKIKALNVEDDICYIKLSEEYNNQVIKAKNELVVYSLVNSLTSLDNIDKVVLTIEGNSSMMYRGNVDISKPMTFNEDIVEERK